MNIFVLHESQKISAEHHCDKHVVKMILEYAQLLSTAHHKHESKYCDVVYKATHINHPCNIWVRATSSNYDWLYSLFVYLCKEYTHRYNKIHKTSRLIPYLQHNPVPHGDFLPIPQAMPDEYKCDDVVEAYRKYYIKEKYNIAKWTKRDIPYWFIGENNETNI